MDDGACSGRGDAVDDRRAGDRPTGSRLVATQCVRLAGNAGSAGAALRADTHRGSFNSADVNRSRRITTTGDSACTGRSVALAASFATDALCLDADNDTAAASGDHDSVPTG